MRRLSLLIAALWTVVFAVAQQQTHVYFNQWKTQWDAPLIIDSIQDITLSDDLKELQFHVKGEAAVPAFLLEDVDSLTFEDDPLVETKDHYKVFQLFITTRDGEDITSRDY